MQAVKLHVIGRKVHLQKDQEMHRNVVNPVYSFTRSSFPATSSTEKVFLAGFDSFNFRSLFSASRSSILESSAFSTSTCVLLSAADTEVKVEESTVPASVEVAVEKLSSVGADTLFSKLCYQQRVFFNLCFII